MTTSPMCVRACVLWIRTCVRENVRCGSGAVVMGCAHAPLDMDEKSDTACGDIWETCTVHLCVCGKGKGGGGEAVWATHRNYT